MLSHVRKTRLLMGSLVLVAALVFLLRRSPDGLMSVARPRPTAAPKPPPLLPQVPPRSPDDPPFLHDPPPLVAQNSLEDTFPLPPKPDHPIEELIIEARFKFSQLLGKQPLTLAQAATRYRERRGRHPPPGFDKWYEAAMQHKSLIVEDFFDRIYHDISPFWGVDPKELQWQTRHQPQYIRIRKGKVSLVSDSSYRPAFVDRWIETIQGMMPHIPDLNMAVNIMDESRVIVPWKRVNELVAVERRDRSMVHPREAINRYSHYDSGDGGEVPFDPGWIRSPAGLYWDHVTAACPPNSSALSVPSLSSLSTPVDHPSSSSPGHLFHGYVRNATISRDVCLQPHMRSMHGTFIEIISMATTKSLFPIFGATKLPQNNDILLPAGAYLEDENMLLGRWHHGGVWEAKKDTIAWRGPAAGGRNKMFNWHHFHRHRFVQMFNASVITALEHGDEEAPPTFQLTPLELYDISAQKDGRLGEWISKISDVAFTHLECFPATPTFMTTLFGRVWQRPAATCPYTDPWYKVARDMSDRELYGHKYIPDIDSSAYSADFRALLRSTSLPLKATIYSEWHDDRLMPWVHYVPLDPSYVDVYGVLDYFMNHELGDANAKKIAQDGRAWAEAAYRPVDMKLYIWRLLLEYARVIDDNRHRLAFVDDLVGL